MNVLMFVPMYNTKGRKDATGAFQPEAEAFLKVLGAPYDKANLLTIDNRRPAKDMARSVIDKLNAVKGIDEVAFFCHGSTGGIQFGFNRRNVAELAAALASATAEDDLTVALYCCLTGGASDDRHGGDGGFADLLRDELCKAGIVNCRVDAHTTAGHTTWNPFVRRFEGMGSPAGGAGGYFIVPPGSKSWARWRKALRSDAPFLGRGGLPARFAFPMLSTAEIHRSLGASA